MKHNLSIVKTTYDCHDTIVGQSTIGAIQVYLPPEKPITSSNGELIVLEKFARFLERLTGCYCPTLALDVTYDIVSPHGERQTAVYSLV